MRQIRKIYEKQKQLAEKWWFPIALFIYNLTLSLIAVLPLMYYALQTVPFCYELNDDALIVQFLDGSYTGVPEAHAFYVRYPLSWIIAELYKRNPTIPTWLWPSGVPGLDMKTAAGSNTAALAANGINWYVFTIAALSVFAMVCVLYRILQAFKGNRLILCFLFDLAIGLLWLPHFFYMTFTTAAAFMGVMGILFWGFMDAKEAWRPWNLLILAILLGSCWCLRRQCFLMVIPFIIVILILKFRLQFFRSWRPWVAAAAICCLTFGLVYAEKTAYGSKAWQSYRAYNSERSWLQDYGRIPDYEGNEKFYQKIGMGNEAVNAFKKYTYCMMDDFGPEKVHAIYEYVYSQQTDHAPDILTSDSIRDSLRELYEYYRPKVEETIPAAQKKYQEPKHISELTVQISNNIWMILIPLLLLSLITVSDHRWSESIALLLEILSLGTLVAGEWVYLVMNGRFPRRIEEIIWLLTVSIGILLAGRILTRWREIQWCRIPGIVQILLLVFIIHYNPLTGMVNAIPDSINALQKSQIDNLAEHVTKAEVLEYCGEHPKSRYVLRTTSFSGASTPYDDLHQGNWFMSGSWAAYSPFYYRKLADDGTGKLGVDFLRRDNVYVITQGENGKANIRRMLGREETEPIYSVITDVLTTSDGTEYLVYKVY